MFDIQVSKYTVTAMKPVSDRFYEVSFDENHNFTHTENFIQRKCTHTLSYSLSIPFLSFSRTLTHTNTYYLYFLFLSHTHTTTLRLLHVERYGENAVAFIFIISQLDIEVLRLGPMSRSFSSWGMYPLTPLPAPSTSMAFFIQEDSSHH